MADLILAEALLLIALDDDSGKDGAGYGSEPGLAGALVLDLVRSGAVTEDGDRLVAAGPPPQHPVLGDVQRAIAEEPEPRKVKDWVDRLPKALKPIAERVADPLVHRGVLEEQRRKRLGLFRTVRFPTVDPGPERRLRDGLREVLVTGREPTEDEALLLSLLEPLSLIDGLVDKPDRKAARRRAKALAERTATGDAVKGAVEATQAAVMVAVMAATTATTATTINS